MRIINITTKAYDRLYRDYYLPSLRRQEADVEIIELEHTSSGAGIFKDKGYMECEIFKLDTLTEYAKTNTGDLIFVTDVDIVWLKPFVNTVESLMNGMDIIWSSDTNPLLSPTFPKEKKINSGMTAFFALRHMADFFMLVKENAQKNSVHNDIAYADVVLRSGLSWDLFDPRFSTCLLHATDIIPDNLIAYHATNMPNQIGLDNKYYQLDKVLRQSCTKENA